MTLNDKHIKPWPECGSFHGEKHKSLGSRIEQTLLAFSRNEDLWLWFPNFGLYIFSFPFDSQILGIFLSFFSSSHSQILKAINSQPWMWHRIFSTFTFHMLDVVYLCCAKFLIFLCGDWCAPPILVCIVQISTHYVLQHSRLTHINPAMHSLSLIY